MKWFQVKEKSAGKKRLLISWYLYNILGRKITTIIAFFVTLITITKSEDIRNSSRKYFEILHKYTHDKKLQPSLINTFKHAFMYADSLIDKAEVFADKFKQTRIVFDDIDQRDELISTIKSKKGVFFICNHIGNIDIMRTFLNQSEYKNDYTATVFLQKNHCKIFNDFVDSIDKKEKKITTIAIEDIDISTAIELEEKLKKGEIVYMAGDRIPCNNEFKCTYVKLLNKDFALPIGVFKLAKMMNSEIYFISCLKEKQNYRIYLKKLQNNFKNTISIQNEFAKFLDKMIKLAPYQFYHFYDVFSD